MWGRLDATNIITPILSIITSISYDHMEFLGDTLEEIASEKWGIIKPWIPMILYGHNPTLETIALERDSRIIFPEKRDIVTNLLGEHQHSNGRIAYEAWIFLGISENIIQDSLLHVDHHGRLEYILPNLLIDGAHNEDGMRSLRMYLSSLVGEIVYCINLKKGKSIQLVLDIFPHVEEYVLVDAGHQMVEDVYIVAADFGAQWKSYTILTPREIITLARKNPGTLFVVFGSLYMVGEFLSWLS
jgi:dihydrofolate synthase / folylpolyglutamate synthase